MKKSTKLTSVGLGLVLASTFGFMHSWASTGEAPAPKPQETIDVTVNTPAADGEETPKGKPLYPDTRKDAEGEQSPAPAAEETTPAGEETAPAETVGTDETPAEPSEADPVSPATETSPSEEPAAETPAAEAPAAEAPAAEVPAKDNSAVEDPAEPVSNSAQEAPAAEETPTPVGGSATLAEKQTPPTQTVTVDAQAPATQEPVKAPVVAAPAAPVKNKVVYVRADRAATPPVGTGVVLAGEAGETNLELDDSVSFTVGYELPMPQGPTAPVGAPLLGEASVMVAPGAEMINAPNANSEAGQALGLNKGTYVNPAHAAPLARTGSVAQYLTLISISTLVVGIGMLGVSVATRRRQKSYEE